MIYSFSRLSLYAACPQRFRFKYIEGWEEPVTKPMALGKAVHKALEQRLSGWDIKEAVIAGLIEADFHPEVSASDITNLVKRLPPLKEGKTEMYFKLPLSANQDI